VQHVDAKLNYGKELDVSLFQNVIGTENVFFSALR